MIIRTALIFLISALSCAAIRISAPDRETEAVLTIIDTYEQARPRILITRLRIVWYLAYWIDVPGKGIKVRGYSYPETGTIHLIITDHISDGPLAHEMMHLAQFRSIPDHMWTDEDWMLVRRANNRLKEKGL